MQDGFWVSAKVGGGVAMAAALLLVCPSHAATTAALKTTYVENAEQQMKIQLQVW